MQSFLNACAYTSSTKLITAFLDTQQTSAFDSLTSVYDGLYGYGQYKTTYYDTSQTTPSGISTYYSALANYANFSTDDYSGLSADTHKYTSVLNSLNTLVNCAGDKWVLNTGNNNCSGYTVWTTSDGQTGGNTSANSMCIA